MMINVLKKFKKTAIVAAIALVASAVAIGVFTTGSEAAEQYDPNGTPTSKTPVFNNFYDVPNGVGNEADFVRVKPASGTNADYVSTLQSTCNTGESFNVRTYVHNGADPAGNGGGNGVAVAHNVAVAMTAELNKEANKFNFTSKITASNAASVSDAAVLLCGNKTVKLQLVPSSVETYSKSLGFQGAPDSAVNGSLKLGSRAQGSGDVWACWDDRVIVVYEVKVVEVPKPEPSTAQCKVLNAAIVNRNERQVSATITAATTNATVLGYEINWGDNSTSNKQTDTHVYAKDGTYPITGRVNVRYANGTTEWLTSTDCKKQITIEKPAEKVPYCQSLTVSELDGRKVRANIVIITNGATINNIEYLWGDGKSTNTTNRSAEHEYAADGTYPITTKMTYTVNGQQKTVPLENCAGSVTFGTPPVNPPEEEEEQPCVPGEDGRDAETGELCVPTTLVETGAASTVAIFAGVTVIGALAHRFLLGRRDA